MRVGNPGKTRLFAAVVIAASIFLPMSKCTQNGKTTTYVPFRDSEVLPMIVLYGLPLLLAIVDLLAKPAWLRLVSRGLEPVSAGFSAYVIWLQAMLQTPVWGFYVVNAGLLVFFVTSIAGFIHEVQRRRAARRQASSSLQPVS